MTFDAMIFKNLKAHARKYLSFFLCNSFAIMVLFNYLMIKFNKDIASSVTKGTSMMIASSLICLVMFAVAFISYGYSAFIKSRYSEFGLFMSMGMTNKEINKMILLENLIMVTLSLFIGLIAGTIFSKLFFLISTYILSIDGINFMISPAAYILSAGIFVVIYLVLALYGNLSVKKLDLSQIMISNRTSEKRKVQHVWLGALGIVLLISAYLVEYLSATKILILGETGSIFALLCFTGLFLIISYFGDTVVSLIKSNKTIYYKNILSIKEIEYKISGNSKAIFIMTMFITLTLFFLGTACTSYFSGMDLLGGGASQNESSLLIMITGFLALLFFIGTVCIIYFKLYSEIDLEKVRYSKLFNIGIVKKEVLKYISVELKILFFIPFFAAVLLVYPLMWIENMEKPNSSLALIILACVIAVYFILQFGVYTFTKNKYINKIA